ncbi:MAG: hypothetical protein WCI18_13880 [Pseudomonadota bacterium]
MRSLPLFFALISCVCSCKTQTGMDSSKTLDAGQRLDVSLSNDQKTITVNDGLRDSALKIEANSLSALVNFVPDDKGQSLRTARLTGELITAFGVNQYQKQIALGVRGMTYNEHVWSMLFLVDLNMPNQPKLLKLYRAGSKKPSDEATNPFARITKIDFTSSNDLFVTHKSSFGSGDSPFYEKVRFDAKGNVVECIKLPEGTSNGSCFDEPKLADFPH